MTIGHLVPLVNELMSIVMPTEAPQPQREADDAADAGEQDRFDQELPQDVAAAGTDGHADADLARPLGDATQHDVHDADAADDAARCRRWRRASASACR